jgi:excisionase family DNA binding protein
MSDFTTRDHHARLAEDPSTNRRADASEPSFSAPLLTRKEAAAYLSISVRKLADLTRDRVVVSVNIPPRSRRYRKADLDRFLEIWSD